MSSASAMRPAAASSAPTGRELLAHLGRGLRRSGISGSSRSPAKSLVRRSAARTSASRAAGPPGSLRPPRAARSGPPPRAAALAELPVRRQRGIVEPEVVGQDTQDVGGVVGPARHADVDFRHGAVPVLSQETGQPGLHDGGQLDRARYRRASSAGPTPQRRGGLRRRPGSSVASRHRSRSISVVTLLGSPRSTGCRSSRTGARPSSFPTRPSTANPSAGSGRMAGTTGKSACRGCVRRGPAAAAGVARPATTRAALNSLAETGPRGGAPLPAGTGPGAASPAPWPAPPPGPTCRSSRHGVLAVTENRGSSNSRRSTAAERASMMSKTRGTIRRPMVLRATVVRSK